MRFGSLSPMGPPLRRLRTHIPPAGAGFTPGTFIGIIGKSKLATLTEAVHMTMNISVALGEHFAEFVQAQVEEGSYGDTSEVVRAGLRLLEEREAKLKALRKAIDEGLESGPPEPFDIEELLSEVEREAANG